MYQEYGIDKLTNQKMPCVKRIEDGACIPFDPANTDYQEFLRWKEEGNTPLPAENE